MHGFYGRILKINLNDKSYRVDTVSSEIYKAYLGGKGLGTYLLHQENPEGIDPLQPDNRLVFATGPVSGNSIWGSCRYGVFTKSPQTGFYAESYAGGKAPEAIDSCGFDAIVIHGKATFPSVLAVFPDRVEFHEADDIWGKDTYTTEDIVLERFSSSEKDLNRPGAVVIGPAAENLVRFAVIENDYWRSAGRTGVGTVMGSKNLKGILFQGNCQRSLYNPDRLKTLFKKMAREAKENPAVNAYKTMGTPMMVKLLNDAKGFPTRYWKEGFCDHWEQINSDALHQRCQVTPHACLKCFMACGRLSTVQQGRHAGLKVEGPEYETIYAFGGLCMIDSIEEIAYLNDVCDRLGLDTITAGNLCAFTMEAVQRGKIDYSIQYGDVDAVAELLEKIAYRRDIGDLLARGIRETAREWNLEDIAVHVKGLEPPGYDPRALKGMGLAYATSDRGACHLRATFYKPELAGMIDPEQIDGKAELFVDFEDRLTLFDTLVLCRFYRDFYTWDGLGEIIHNTCGIYADKTALQKIAANVLNLTRNFNLREGLTVEDDKLPVALHRKLHDTGAVITEEEMNTMVRDYYRIRGWSNCISR